MKQQINLYQGGLRRERPAFSALAMSGSIAVCVLVLVGAWFLADAHAREMDLELDAMQRQEAAAAARLEKLTAALAAREGGAGAENAEDTLTEALAALAQRERLLTLIDGQGFGATTGFSRPLRALARHRLDGLWLTRVLILAPGMRTTLEGRARTPSLVPEYLLGLSAQGDLSGQRFDQFEIERSESDATTVRFSMTSDVAEQLARGSDTP